MLLLLQFQIKKQKRWQTAIGTSIKDAHTERRVVQLKVDTCRKWGEEGREELTKSGCPIFHDEFLGFLSKMSKILLQSTSKPIKNSLRTVKSKSSGSCLFFVINGLSIKNGTCGHVVRSNCSQKVRT